ncbi:hypothetical protein HYS54_01905 [Candidatus Micrarchaeota archaeon]|nr:hypothetical protein [Candidatus Micrarchaeota archaeon]
MVQTIRRVRVTGVPRLVVLRAVESIGLALIADAKQRFGSSGFKSDLRVDEKRGYVESFIKFWPYKYDFIWRVEGEKQLNVTLDCRTGGSWYEFAFDIAQKARTLTESQWSALLNFCMGYLTAGAVAKGGVKQARKHITRAKGGIIHS